MRGFVPVPRSSVEAAGGGPAKEDGAEGKRAGGPQAGGLAGPSSGGASTRSGKGGTAADHTYDKGYKKWENFDPDTAEVREVDEGRRSAGAGGGATGSADVALGPHAYAAAQGGVGTSAVAPAKAHARRVHRTRAGVSKSHRSREEVEREDGNAHFRAGRFLDAVTCYTRCVALNPRNVVAYSNRAMAYLRLKEFARAEEDCTSALAIDPEHIKSIQRRATARNSLGRHRAALADIQLALELARAEAGEAAGGAISAVVKKLHVDLRKTIDMHKTAVRKAPRTKVAVTALVGPAGPGDRPRPSPGAEEAAAGSTEPPAAPSVGVVDSVDKAPALPEGAVTQANGETQGAGGAGDAGGPVPRSPAEAARMRKAAEAAASAETAAAASAPAASSGASGDADKGAGGAGGTAPAEAVSGPAEAAAARPARKAKTKTARGTAGAPGVVVKPKLPAKLPKTGYEFQRVWRGLRSDPSLRAELLRKYPSKALSTVFKSGLESDLLGELVGIIHEHLAESRAVDAARIMHALSKGSSLGMTLMMLSAKERESITAMFDRIAANIGGDATAATALAAAQKKFAC